VKSIYIPSVERFSGKTATCLALGRHLQVDGYKIGYLKPLSFNPWRIGDKIVDEDAAFAKEILRLEAEPWDISPVVITPELLRSYLRGKQKDDLFQKIKDAFERIRKENDVILFEGGGSLREGYVVGLPTTEVVQALGSDVLAVVKYRGHIRIMDDTLAAQTRLGDSLRGVIINRIPADANDFVKQDAIPFFEKQGIPILGLIPETRSLEAMTVQELYDVLGAQLLTETYDPEAFVENLTIGAMTAEAALHRFRKQTNKAVITGGDRSDIQLAALETSTICLVLTGNLQPSPLIIKQAEDLGVSAFLVPGTTMETIETIERIFGKTRLGQLNKLEQYEKLFSENVDMKKLYKVFGLKKS
jgi:BioD-like phosphotransacetylase family protein